MLSSLRTGTRGGKCWKKAGTVQYSSAFSFRNGRVAYANNCRDDTMAMFIAIIPLPLRRERSLHTYGLACFHAFKTEHVEREAGCEQ